MLGFSLAIASAGCAVLPALVFARNLFLYRPLSKQTESLPLLMDENGKKSGLSILIPARNEEASIGEAIESAISSISRTAGIPIEVIVMDDGSTDDTERIVAKISQRDERVRLVTAPPLPGGWCGKQHACFQLSKVARYDLFLFLDADVRLESHAPERMISYLLTHEIDLLSGFPRQITESLTEKLVLPLMHFVLLGFLPMDQMRSTRKPSFGAGCGQLFLIRKEAYDSCGGHGEIRESLHDGVKLPRAFRAAGFSTDLFDATDIARCRMYRSTHEVFFGLLKNAGEGLAAPRLIVPATVILVVGQVLPIPLLLYFLLAPGASEGELSGLWFAALATSILASLYPRFHAAWRFRQPWISPLLHPVGVMMLLFIQWASLVRQLLGSNPTWKGRTYGGAADEEEREEGAPSG